MKQAIEQAIKAYADISGVSEREVAQECLKEGPIRKAVMLLLFSQANA